MPSMDDIVRHQTTLERSDLLWLQRLVTDWQIIADLSFADLVLWVADAESKGFWAAAQIRPTTGPTSLIDDVVGTFLPASNAEVLERSLRLGRAEVAGADDTDGAAVRAETIPVRRGPSVVALVVRRTNLAGIRNPSALESAYLESADVLLAMIARGEFPIGGTRSDVADSLRVGDGFLRTDALGTVTYASPNALSAYRRIGLSGDLVGGRLAEVTQRLVGTRPTDAAPLNVLDGRQSDEAEIESSGASMLVRTLPLRVDGRHAGALILLRDVTELRSRERELVSKEATIREIHHRVKNNLQTVAALLRLQGRRLDNPEARAALDEAVRRVGSIALVHETLSQSFDETVAFDEIADRLLRTVLEMSGGAGAAVAGDRVGSFGAVKGETATPLAMVLTELIQNAAEHAFADRGPDGAPGRLTLAVNRIRDRLRVRVSDDGSGLPVDFDPAGSLGLSIVQTLVEAELGGTLTFESRPGRGTTVDIDVTV